MRKSLLRGAGAALVLLLFNALPLPGGINSVSFKTSRNVSFY